LLDQLFCQINRIWIVPFENFQSVYIESHGNVIFAAKTPCGQPGTSDNQDKKKIGLLILYQPLRRFTGLTLRGTQNPVRFPVILRHLRGSGSGKNAYPMAFHRQGTGKLMTEFGYPACIRLEV
jgi:hypothetical protein